MRTWRALGWTGCLLAAALLGCDDPASAPPPPDTLAHAASPAQWPHAPVAHTGRLANRPHWLMPPGTGHLEPDFALVDANAHSATHMQTCSPRQQLGHISAWYFSHAT